MFIHQIILFDNLFIKRDCYREISNVYYELQGIWGVVLVDSCLQGVSGYQLCATTGKRKKHAISTLAPFSDPKEIRKIIFELMNYLELALAGGWGPILITFECQNRPFDKQLKGLCFIFIALIQKLSFYHHSYLQVSPKCKYWCLLQFTQLNLFRRSEESQTYSLGY